VIALPGGFALDHRLVTGIRVLLAFGALSLLLRELTVTHATARLAKRRDLALGVIGAASIAAWFNFGALHGPGRPVHLHDFFHYYAGSKYFAELGYTRLYQCVAVEEVQQGRAMDVASRWTRDLTTNELKRELPTGEQTAECLRVFGPTRWAAFTADVEWFRARMSPAEWAEVQDVFGHNATPAWSAMGYWLTRWGPASERQILALATLDAVLIAGIWFLLWRTFGWPAASVAAVWWGLNEASAFFWVGGAFLRQDAMVLLAGAVCALRTNRRFLAGTLLASAVLLRAYPLFIVAALAVPAVWHARVKGVPETIRAYRSLAAGLSIAAAVLLTFSTLTWKAQGLSPLAPWKGFAVNSQKHLSTPITNHVGLKPVLWFDPDTRAVKLSQFWLDGPWDTWRAARTQTFESRKPLYAAIVIAFVARFAASVRSLPDWIVLILGVALLPFVTTVANYYYAAFMLFGLLWPIDKAIGVAVAVLTVATLMAGALFREVDDRYAIISAAIVLFAIFVVFRTRSIRQIVAGPFPHRVPEYTV
jgi:hypothetical protein